MRSFQATLVLAIPLAVGAICAAAPAPTAGQISDMPPVMGTTLGLELGKPLFENDPFDFHSSVLLARLLTPIHPSAHVYVELGLVVAGASSSSSYALSNPEIGLLLSDERGRPSGYLSVGLPTSHEFGDDDFATEFGLFHDPERLDRFAQDMWSANGAFTPVVDLGPTSEVRFDVGASAMLPGGDVDPELFARYGAAFALQADRVRVGAELSGLAIVTEDELSFSQRTLHQVILKVGPSAGRGLFVRLPLDDVLDDIDAVVGLSWTF